MSKLYLLDVPVLDFPRWDSVRVWGHSQRSLEIPHGKTMSIIHLPKDAFIRLADMGESKTMPVTSYDVMMCLDAYALFEQVPRNLQLILATHWLRVVVDPEPLRVT